MLGVVADAGVGYIAMHMLGDPRSMQEAPHYDDVVDEVGAFLVERLAAARAAGVNEASLVADPGIGFGKTVTHNLDLLARLRELVERVDAPLLVGTSRKRFLGSVLAHVAGVDGIPGARGARRRHARVGRLGTGPGRADRAGPRRPLVGASSAAPRRARSGRRVMAVALT